ncbi:MaoC/PaaZ C-terminal domain-containing protein [Amycolatopsis sp. NPDC051903]|uniref:MaoC/PaaZ C-terminal domain-containing protein n=1 Tax=Amycolatopsis sp. NPDC051903 TaxID=3363936 RepID=UPI00379B5F37
MSVDSAFTPRPINPSGLWADDLFAGMEFRSSTCTVTEAAIVAFAESFDPQLYHLDAAAARGTFFDGLVASGWHTAAITMRLLVTSGVPLATGIVGAAIDLSWPSAARAGDVLHVEGRVDEIAFSRSRPSRATVVLSYKTENQAGEVRQNTQARVVAFRRPQSPDGR